MSQLPDSTPEERFAAALHATARSWRLALDARLKDLGVGQSGWLTIAMIAKSKVDLSQRALADLLAVEGPSVVAMVDRLEQAGLVTRAPDPGDRRVKLVLLTDAGRALYAKVRTQADAFRASVLAGVDPDELAAATRLLEALRERIEEPL
ncbi:MarR family winged helix-turn-helix transcriptional regulator [Massilia horti]|uniref:MarR family transcriptional regulator n=1 Tax=Massilia horti TaxID=2562153 RepID=A0A4Y9T4N3_9BURK|nr:MarR family transcriptional regulator [Massilia horti]TFW34670.1 MarR family transcriptional regulator [Massilia horti]